MSGTAAVSPLQRMASITNSLISQQASAPSHTTQSPRPLKAVLPPITQQQFDQFNNLNTEEIVRKVRQIVSSLFAPPLLSCLPFVVGASPSRART